MSTGLEIEPFTVAIGDVVLDDLRERLRRTRWPDEPAGSGWEYGTNLGYLKDLMSYWEGQFDWRAQQRSLNRLAHFRADIDGHDVHFIHEKGIGAAPLPLILTHGWPSSFIEYLDLMPLLTDPAAHGADPADAFDVVVPSVPGFGFSTRPGLPGMLSDEVAEVWSRLMSDGLGYTRFGAHGGDIGAGITARLAQRHPDTVLGIHLTAWGAPMPPKPWSLAERNYLAASAEWDEAEGAYSHVQATTPQTLGFGLTDSPAGLAAWIVEKIRSWSDSDGHPESHMPRDRLLTNLTIYWATATIASSMRPYYEYRRRGTPLSTDPPVDVPTGFAIFANEFVPQGRLPRELAERYFPVTRWIELPRGGHFPALEEPQLLAQEIRAFFRPLRAR